MFTDPLFLFVAFIAVLLVGLAKGGFSGIGMAATPLLALAVPPLQALAILLPILLVQDVVSIWWYRRDWDGWNLKVMLPGAMFGVGLAWAVGSVVPDNVVRLIIGVIGVTFVLNSWFGKVPPPGRPSAASGVFWGAGAGFTSTIASAGMPPFSIHVLPQRMEKMRLVGTVTMFFAAVNLMRVVPYFALGHLTRDNLMISLALLPLAIAANFLGFWLVLRISTELFYRIAYALMFLISAAIFAQGVTGLLRGSSYTGRMRRTAPRPAARPCGGTPAQAFDLQGHRGARGLAPENTLEGFALALSIGVTTLELDLAMTRDDVLVVSHDRRLNPDHTRGPDGKFLDRRRPADPHAHARRAAALRRRPAQAGQRLCGGLSGAAAGRRRAHPDARGAVRSGARAGADHVRFNIETKITPTSGAETPDPDSVRRRRSRRRSARRA